MYGTIIKSVRAHQVYTNRGKPGVEVIVTTENGSEGRAMCTSGVSIGTHEVDFTFDGGTKFGGKGVTGAAKRVEEVIAPVIIGMDAANQAEVDAAILGIYPDAKIRLGGNAVAATSAAVLKAGAKALGIPLYRHIGGAGAMYLPVPGVAMAAGDERYGGGITTPGGKPTMSIMAYGFDKFADASNKLGTQMKATGEVMSIGKSYEESLLKAVRSLETGVYHLWMAKFDNLSTEELLEYSKDGSDDRIFAVSELIRRVVAIETIANKTKIVAYFLEGIKKCCCEIKVASAS